MTQVLISAKPRVYVPPRYHGGYECQKGETITLKIPFKGHPQPTSRWTKDGVPLESNARIQIETSDRCYLQTEHNSLIQYVNLVLQS